MKEFDYQLWAHFDHSFPLSLELFLFGFARVGSLDLVVQLLQGPGGGRGGPALEEGEEGAVEEEASWNDDDWDVSYYGGSIFRAKKLNGCARGKAN